MRRLLAILASLMLFSGQAFAQQPVQWNYNFNAGTATATYPGNVIIQGSCTGCSSSSQTPATGYDVTNFGAKCDGATNDSAAIQATIAYAATHYGKVLIPPSANGCVAAITITNDNIAIEGAGGTVNIGGSSRLIAPDASSSVITVGQTGGFKLSDITLQGFSSTPSDYTSSVPPLLSISVAATPQVNTVWLENVSAYYGYDLVKLNNVNNLRWFGGNLRDFTHSAINITGTPGTVPGGGSDQFFYGIVSDQDSAAWQNVGTLKANVYITQSGGAVTFDGSDLLHGHAGIWADPGPGQFVSWIYAVNTYTDTCDFLNTTVSGATNVGSGPGGATPATFVPGAAGFKFTPHGGATVNGMFITNSWASTCQNGVNATGDGASVLSGVFISNLQSLNNGADGIYLSYATDVSIDNSLIVGASELSPGTYSAITLDTGADHVVVNGGRAGPGQGYAGTMKFGLQINAAFTGYLTANNSDMQGNATNAVFNGSSSSNIFVSGIRGYNPVGAANLTPGASPWTYTAGISPETVNLFDSGGSFTAALGAIQTCPPTSTQCTVVLNPHQSVQVTYTGTLSARSNIQ